MEISNTDGISKQNICGRLLSKKNFRSFQAPEVRFMCKNLFLSQDIFLSFLQFSSEVKIVVCDGNIIHACS